MAKRASAEKRSEWEERVRKQRESGLSIAKWCGQQHISTHLFHYWRKRIFLNQELNRSCFTELAETQEGGVLIECGGLKIRLEKGFDPATLRDCLSVLRKIAC